MAGFTGFEVTDEDVRAVAESLGQDVDLDGAEEIRARLTDVELSSIQRAALHGDGLDEQTEAAHAKLGEILVAKGVLAPPPSPR